jgi:hypothetical protein
MSVLNSNNSNNFNSELNKVNTRNVKKKPKPLPLMHIKMPDSIKLIDFKSNYILYSTEFLDSVSFGIIEFPKGKVILVKNFPSFSGSTTIISSIALSPLGTYYAVGIMEKDSNKTEYTIIFGKIKEVNKFIFKSKGKIYSLEFSPDENYLVICLESYIEIYNLNKTTNNKSTYSPLSNINNSISFNLYNSINSINSTSLTEAVSFSPDSSLLAYNSGRFLKIWDVSTKNLMATFDKYFGIIKMICFSPNNKFIAAFTKYYDFIIWNLETLSIVSRIIEDYPGKLLSIIFSLDSTKILTASFIKGEYYDTHNLVVKSWNVENGQKINTITGYYEKRHIISASFSEDRRYICYTYGNSIKSLNIEYLQAGGKKIKSKKQINTFKKSDLIKISKKHDISLQTKDKSAKTKLQLFNSLKRKKLI